MRFANRELRRLRHAVVLGEAGSYRRAAEQLHLTQSALSRSVQALEDELGIRLFDRGRAGVHPTIAGRAFLERAVALLREARGLEVFAAGLAGGEAGELRIGLGPVPAAMLLPDLLVGLMTDRPGLKLGIAVQPAARLLAALVSEQVELIVCAETLVDRRAPLVVTRLLTVRPRLLVRAGHPLLGPHKRLADYPLAVGGHGSESGPVTPGTDGASVECDDFATLRALTLATDLVWLTAPQTARAELADGSLVALPSASAVDRDPGAEFALATVRLQGRTPSPAGLHAEALITGLLRG